MTWDAKRAADLVGRTILLRLHLEDADEGARTVDQRGTITSAGEDGITAKSADGSTFTIPPELDSIAPAPADAGADLLSVWTVVGYGTGNEAWTPGSDEPPSRRRWGGGGPRRGRR